MINSNGLATIKYQNIGKNIAINFFLEHPLLSRRLALDVNVLKEPVLDENNQVIKTEICPDVVYFESYDEEEGQGDNPLLVIEIIHTSGNKTEAKKNIARLFEEFESLQEAFLYDYSKDLFFRLTPANNQYGYNIAEGDDWSVVWKLSLSDLVCQTPSKLY